MVACKRNPKLAYVRREGTAKQRAFPVVIRPRKVNAFKGIPVLARSWIPRWGGARGRDCAISIGPVKDGGRGGGSGHSRRSCGGVRVASFNL